MDSKTSTNVGKRAAEDDADTSLNQNSKRARVEDEQPCVVSEISQGNKGVVTSYITVEPSQRSEEVSTLKKETDSLVLNAVVSSPKVKEVIVISDDEEDDDSDDASSSSESIQWDYESSSCNSPVQPVANIHGSSALSQDSIHSSEVSALVKSEDWGQIHSYREAGLTRDNPLIVSSEGEDETESLGDTNSYINDEDDEGSVTSEYTISEDRTWEYPNSLASDGDMDSASDDSSDNESCSGSDDSSCPEDKVDPKMPQHSDDADDFADD